MPVRDGVPDDVVDALPVALGEPLEEGVPVEVMLLVRDGECDVCGGGKQQPGASLKMLLKSPIYCTM